MPLSDGQMQWRSLTLGAGVYRLQQVEGWGDLPALDVGDVDRPTSHGAWPGARYAQGRTITADVRVVAPGDGGAAIRTLIDQTGLSGADAEEALTVSLWGRSLVCSARMARRGLSATLDYSSGVTTVPLQWQATDPRLYDPADPPVATGLPSSPSGLTFSLTFPLTFGSAGMSGNITATNLGNADSHPLITLSGACTTPAVTNAATGLVLEFDLTLASGDSLVIDCRSGAVTLNGVASRIGQLTSRSALLRQFVLSPGGNELRFRANSGSAATMTCSRVSAWM